MFAPYTPIDKCVGKELRIRVAGEDYVGLLAGVYVTGGIPVMVITPMAAGGSEQHIPIPGAVVTIRHEK